MNNEHNLGGSIGYQYNNSIIRTQYYDPDKIWICFYNKNETPYYCLKENVSLNENLTISMTDLAPMENFIEYEFPLAEYSDVYLVSNHIFENDIEAHFSSITFSNTRVQVQLDVIIPQICFLKLISVLLL